MTIFIEGKEKPALIGLKPWDAVDVETADGSDVEAKLAAVEAQAQLVSGNPYKYFQRLRVGSGLNQLPTGNQTLGLSNSHTLTHVLVSEQNTIGGIVHDVPFFTSLFGEFKANVTTAVTLRLTLRFVHFSNTPNEFSNVQQFERRFSSARQTTVPLTDLSSPPVVVPLGPLSIPGGPTFNVTEEFLNTPFPFRVELDIQAFDTATGEVATDTVLSDLELVDATLVYWQLNRLALGTAPSGGTPSDPADLASLESKVNALFPLTPRVPDLVDLGDNYDAAHTTENVAPIPGYSNFIDYRSDAVRFESPGITYDATGLNVVDYTGLADDPHRGIGLQVAAASNKTLFSIVNGAEVIPFIDITAAGNLRVNDYVPARTENQEVTGHVVLIRAATSGTGILTSNGAISTYTIPPYPANTSAQSRSASLGLEVLISGTDSRAEGFVTLEIPNTLVGQGRQTIEHVFQLGYPSNRVVTATIAYELRVSGSDLLLDLSLVSITDSTATLAVRDLALIQNYTASVAIARVDDFQIFGDGFGSFVFSGAYEFLFVFHPFSDRGTADVVVVARNISTGVVTQLNDLTVPEVADDFSAVQIPDDIEFRTFVPNHFLTHADLANLIPSSAIQWVYGLNRRNLVTARAFTQRVDFSNNFVLTSPDSSRWEVSIDDLGVLQTVKLP